MEVVKETITDSTVWRHARVHVMMTTMMVSYMCIATTESVGNILIKWC